MMYLGLLLLSFSLTYLIKNYAIKKSLVDIPNERSSHTTPTPHGGGIAIAITWFNGISYLFFLGEIQSSLYFALMSGTLISLVSYIDDIRELSPKIRLLTQSFVAVVALSSLGGFSALDFYFFSIVNPLVTNIFAFFMIIWFINLYNFLDGIDGYAGSESLFLALAAFTLFGSNLFLVLAVSVLGFLYWNWHKAKIFMGDVGSTMLGFNIAVFTIYYTNQEPSNFWIWITLFGLFWFDATLTLLRRFLNKEKLSIAHKKHAYQRLTQSGYSHSKVVLFAMLLNTFLFGIVYFVSNVLVAFLMVIVVLYISVRLVDRRKGFE